MAFQKKVLGLNELRFSFRALKNLVTGGAMADALADGAEIIVKETRANLIRRGLYVSGALSDSVAVRKVNQFQVDVKVNSPYGAAHEFGLEKQEITPRQRSFFWAMWASTKNEMWKWLALSETYTIPMKPYLRPAIQKKKLQAAKVASKSLAKAMRAAVPAA